MISARTRDRGARTAEESEIKNAPPYVRSLGVGGGGKPGSIHHMEGISVVDWQVTGY
jgi:hypothetical protein